MLFTCQIFEILLLLAWEEKYIPWEEGAALLQLSFEVDDSMQIYLTNKVKVLDPNSTSVTEYPAFYRAKKGPK